ncbi:MAG TPA: hypothetical protein VNR66_15515 [Solirubrobacteraceae bacterium]|nr:hypothetical protein [Solirubrobacteraceae bacterium]
MRVRNSALSAVGSRSVCGSDPGDGRGTRGRGRTRWTTGADGAVATVVVLLADALDAGGLAGRDAL